MGVGGSVPPTYWGVAFVYANLSTMWHVTFESAKKWEWERQPARENGSGKTSASHILGCCIFVCKFINMWHFNLLKSRSGGKKGQPGKMGAGGPVSCSCIMQMYQPCDMCHVSMLKSGSGSASHPGKKGVGGPVPPMYRAVALCKFINHLTCDMWAC